MDAGVRWSIAIGNGMSFLTMTEVGSPPGEGESKPAVSSWNDSYVGQLVREAPILQDTVTCGEIAQQLARHPEVPAIVIGTSDGQYGLVDRATYLPRYLDRFNRDLYHRKSISTLMDKNPLIVDWRTPIERVGLLAASGSADSVRAAFIIVRGGACIGIGMGVDLMNIIAKEAQGRLLQLQQALDSLVQAQTFASLGRLVAGVAHEINTPIGVSLTAATHLHGRVADLQGRFEENKMTRSDLTGFTAAAKEASSIIVENIERAADLIRSFKSVAVDRTMAERRRFNLRELIEKTSRSLGLSLSKNQLEIHLECDPDLEMDSYPGPLAQTLANLMINSATHAFDPGHGGSFFVSVAAQSGWVDILCRDNGRGIPSQSLTQIFKPFFTTRRLEGGTGLGLHIVHNIVTQILGGTIACDSKVGVGTSFRLHLRQVIESDAISEDQETAEIQRIYDPTISTPINTQGA